MKMKRHGSAEWNGGLKDGKGTTSTESRALNQSQYSFTTWFEEGQGELIQKNWKLDGIHYRCF